mmetsp:Transcript_58858/g.105743  ORF Transcript_58858/g.105743 Transcript_58858/m.105743 type:complete len:532 (+) Transcript_58858:124-1719(+)
MATTLTVTEVGKDQNNEDKGYSRSGTIRMTPESVQELCQERHMWTVPHLNTQLFLNYKGFEYIDGLEDYVNVKALHLGNNNIATIQGLDRMSQLRSLHLEGNRIQCIGNLRANLELRQLSLEANAIRRVTGLAHLTKLEQLNLAKNAIEDLDGLQELQSLPSLANVDVSHNQLETSDGVVEFWSGLPNVRVLRYHGNPGIHNIEHYRKRMVNSMLELRYLDERPVFPVERKSCAAWAEGGLQAMQQAKKDFFKEKHRNENANDPERGEFLTRMRKLAIARIDAAEREQQEKAAQAGGETMPLAPSAVQLGDVAALEEYAKGWQTKIEQLGADQVRSQIASDGASSSNVSEATKAKAAVAEAQRKALEAQVKQSRARVELLPPESRGAAGESGAERPRFAPPSRSVASASGSKGASDFMASSRNSARGGDEQAENPFQDRQFAVLGEEVWGNPVSGLGGQGLTGPEQSRGPRQAVEEDVVPDLWKKLGPANREAELRDMEMNLKASAAWSQDAKEAREAAPTGGSDELNGLD